MTTPLQLEGVTWWTRHRFNKTNIDEMVAPYDEVNHCQTEGDEKPHNIMMQSDTEAETGRNMQ